MKKDLGCCSSSTIVGAKIIFLFAKMIICKTDAKIEKISQANI